MTDVLVVSHYPVAGLSVGESGKLQGAPAPLQLLPALSGADSASPQTDCENSTPRLAALIHVLQMDVNLGQILKSSQGDKTKIYLKVKYKHVLVFKIIHTYRLEYCFYTLESLPVL